MPLNTKIPKDKQALRYNVLRFAYDNVDEVPGGEITTSSVMEHLSVSREEAQGVLGYLSTRGFIEKVRPPNISDGFYKVTGAGIEEIEQSQRSGKPTENFTQNFYGQVGAIQNAPHSTAHISQNSGVDLAEVFDLMEQLKRQVEALPEDRREDTHDALEAIEEELNAEEPKPKKLKTMIKGLLSNISGATAFSANVTLLAQRLQELGLI